MTFWPLREIGDEIPHNNTDAKIFKKTNVFGLFNVYGDSEHGEELSENQLPGFSCVSLWERSSHSVATLPHCLSLLA